MRLPRTSFCIATFSLALPLASAFAAPVCPGGGTAPGTITLTEKKLEPAQANSAKDLKAEQRCVLSKVEGDEGWKLHLIAHLNKAPGADEVNIVLYDSTKPAQPHDPVQAYPIRTKKDGKVMMAEVEIKPEEGFKAGGKYNVFIARLLANGKEEVYARTTLELK